MAISPLAGKHAPPALLIDIPALWDEYYTTTPDPGDPLQRVSFGTSGHRGTASNGSFNEAHILAITQAVVEYRRIAGIAGPLFLGMDSHALSEPAQRTVLEVLAAHAVEVYVAEGGGFTPTPVISHAILTHNAAGKSQSDGLILTPSHNPPGDGGIKYNPPSGGPADTRITGWIQDRANELLAGGASGVRRVSEEQAMRVPSTHLHDYIRPYVSDLASVIDLDVIRGSGLRLGADPLGGSSVAYWEPIAELYGLDIKVVNSRVDRTFGFMPVDRDGKIRMDCSSPYAMADLVHLKDQYDIAFGNDTDADRHGIVAPSVGLLNPNHFLSVAISYLFSNRTGWRTDSAIGKTVVSSSMIDRVGKTLGRRVAEVPVGFKWFVEGLVDGSYGFGGEESAGASFLRQDGTVWTTDKDGLIMGLLAAEITARTGRDPGIHYRELTELLGAPIYTRVDAPASPEQKSRLKKLDPSDVQATTLAGDAIVDRLTRAPGNSAEIGGLKVVTEQGWFAARPSGTEDVYKIYAESFRSQEHLDEILSEAKEIVAAAL